MLTTYAPTNLRLEALDPLLWREANHIDLKRLWNYLTQYPYLPRLKDTSVLLESVRNGVASTAWADSFAYAEGFDETKGKYLGLSIATGITPTISFQSLLVKPEIAQKQLDEVQPPEPKPIPLEPDGPVGGISPPKPEPSPFPLTPKTSRFYGSVQLAPLRINRDVSAIADEVIRHLAALNGAQVKITLEVEANFPEGATDEVTRTVTENCRTLKFTSYEFEAE
ncbi:MAG: hypothetical protein IGS16_12485 [Thermoleptolyngbya sp. C42_A2020_037]|nr:hypothetical protein [Thermoleptolyngbya sp. C42_A2020_037]